MAAITNDPKIATFTWAVFLNGVSGAANEWHYSDCWPRQLISTYPSIPLVV